VKQKALPAFAVILAGGRGTRFWPRSRARAPKQLLNIVGEKTMLEETVERLLPSFPPSHIWAVTNREQAGMLRRQAPRVPRAHVLIEPVGRNTAAAVGLAAIHLARHSADALMAVLPADHYIARAQQYRRIVRAALEIAARGPHLVILGIPATRAETGYGYIERARLAARVRGLPVYHVRRFTEKPQLARARQYVASGRYYWNAGMFFWRVATFLECLRKFLPATHGALMKLADDIETPPYTKHLRRIYPQLENISVDYAILEPATRRAEQQNVFVLPAAVGWSDIGSWEAVYELLARKAGENVCAGPGMAIDARGNFFWSPRKFVAAIGVNDSIVVETADALLVCRRNRAQDVNKVVRWLEENKRQPLL
jgi:mannose-1-phosphate guanylyltransferase